MAAAVKEIDGDDNDNDSEEAKLGGSGNSLDKYVGKGRNSKYMTLLPEDFEPGDMDVLCGRGKRCFNSPVSIVIQYSSKTRLVFKLCAER